MSRRSDDHLDNEPVPLVWVAVDDGLGSHDNQPGPSSRTGQGRVIAGLAIGAVFFVWLLAQGSGRDDGELRAANEATPTALVSATTAPLAELQERRTFVGPVPSAVIIATRHDGGVPFRLFTGAEVDRTDDLPARSRFAIDRGGDWLAATTTNVLTLEDVLWVGPVDGSEPMEPVVTGIRGFAWHDTEPALLAYGSGADGDETGAIMQLDFTRRRPRPAALVATDGWLSSWGGWGFVVATGRNAGWFDVLSATGEVIVGRHRGVPSGYAIGHGVIASSWGERAQPSAIRIETGAPTAVEWLDDKHYVWGLANNEHHGLTAVHASNLDERRHEVLIVDAEGTILQRFRAAGGSAAMSWTSNGDALLHVRDDYQTETMLVVYDVASDRVDEWPLASLDPYEHWSRAIAPQ